MENTKKIRYGIIYQHHQGSNKNAISKHLRFSQGKKKRIGGEGHDDE